MEAEPASNDSKKSEQNGGAFTEATALTASSSAERKKAWHESKKLLKRVAFLLDDPSIIPPDIFFHVGEEAAHFDGHKIFFALASPVFHALLYGNNKMEVSFLFVPDVTTEAFQCLKKYAYTDSFASISVANVMDVLVASQKYLMAKLTRYCYEFIQKKLTALTACFFWKTARQAGTEIVEKQCIAEIKRNTSKVVWSKGFWELPKELVMELTSWNELTVLEPNLYRAVHEWATHKTFFNSIKFDREEGGIFQHIRFALFPKEHLAAEQAATKILSAEDFQELCLHELVGEELFSFNPNHRTPAAPSFRLSLSIYVSKPSKKQSGTTTSSTNRQPYGKITLLLWPDVAPKACQVLRQYVQESFDFGLRIMVDPRGSSFTYFRTVEKKNLINKAVIHPATEAMQDVEKTSAMWSSPSFVCFKFSDEEPHYPELTVLNTSFTNLEGKLPESVFGEASEYGAVIGKVLDGHIDRVRKLTAVEYQAGEAECCDFEVAFECALVE